VVKIANQTLHLGEGGLDGGLAKGLILRHDGQVDDRARLLKHKVTPVHMDT
jgi:hypothetical protein